MNLCTLFDSNYIDRALVMYDSLISVCNDVNLYVIAFDEKCFETLNEMNLSNMVVVSYNEFEDDALKDAKRNRSRREFLWTCSGYSIRYLMKRFDLPDLTYIDSDLYFYESPEKSLQVFLESDCDAAIIPHNYSKHIENTYTKKKCGTYCVEFNSFKNTPNGMHILDWWIDECLESCPEIATNNAFGDQKYLDQFERLFQGIYIYNEFGMGIAPWNVDDYITAVKTAETRDPIIIANKHTHKKGSIIFYHFHSLDVFEDGTSNIRVFIRPGRQDRKLIESLYKPYIHQLIDKRKYLNERFGLYESKNATVQKIHEGELRSFLTSEPNLLFLIRKIWRYMLYKRNDYISI